MTRRKQKGDIPKNYRVHDAGRVYRLCTTSYHRVLMVMLKHKRGGETALTPNGRRAREIINAATKQHGIVFL